MKPASYSKKDMMGYVLEFSPSLICDKCGNSLGNDSSEVSDNCGRCGSPTDMTAYKNHWRSYVDTTLRAEYGDPGHVDSEMAMCAFRNLAIDKTFASGTLAILKKYDPIIEEHRAKAEELQTKAIAARKAADDFATSRAAATEVKCSKCGSKQIAPFKKGFGLGKSVAGAVVAGPVGLLAGMFGSNRVLLHCLSCGNQWEASKAPTYT